MIKGREITLEQLAQESANNQNAPVRTTKFTPRPAMGKAMSPADVASHLTNAGIIEEKKEEIVDAPVVANAFNRMKQTLQKRRENIEKTLPFVYENARDIALERELGESSDESPEETPSQTEQSESIDTTNLDSDDENIDSILGPATATYTAPPEILNTPVKSENLIQDGISTEFGSTTSVINTADAWQDLETEDKTPAEEEKPVEDNPEEVPVWNTTDNSLDDMLKELENEDSHIVVDDEEETAEEIRTRLKNSMSNVSIIQNPLDITSFKIRSKPVAVSSVLQGINVGKTIKRADWVLYHTGRSMTFTECSGPELDTLRKNIANANNINSVVIALKFIYDHVYDPNKPAFESWCKLIRTEDIESLYYGIYRACYASSNIVSRECEKRKDGKNRNIGCGKTSLIETNIDDMVVYGGEEDDHDEIKKKFMRIYNGDTTSAFNSFEKELMQISDNLAISYGHATLFSTIVQFSALRADISEKYGDTLDTLAYIEDFFAIDSSSKELVPIAIKTYPNNFNKTILSKLKTYTAILNSLTTDQYNNLIGKLNNIIEDPKIRYILPETKCPECGATIPEAPVDSMLNLLFTRARLAQIKSL